MHVGKSDNPISRVSCSVNTCHYHVPGDHCSAEKIQVAPKNAHSTQETDCETFISKT